MALLSWVVVIILIVIVLVFFKMRHFKHRVYAILLILFILFFYISFTKVISGQNLKSFEGIMSAGKIYLSWLWRALINAKDITANVIGDVRGTNWSGNLTG